MVELRLSFCPVQEETTLETLKDTLHHTARVWGNRFPTRADMPVSSTY